MMLKNYSIKSKFLLGASSLLLGMVFLSKITINQAHAASSFQLNVMPQLAVQIKPQHQPQVYTTTTYIKTTPYYQHDNNRYYVQDVQQKVEYPHHQRRIIREITTEPAYYGAYNRYNYQNRNHKYQYKHKYKNQHQQTIYQGYQVYQNHPYNHPYTYSNYSNEYDNAAYTQPRTRISYEWRYEN